MWSEEWEREKEETTGRQTVSVCRVETRECFGGGGGFDGMM